MMKKQLLILSLLLAGFWRPVRAEDRPQGTGESPMVEVVDVPTADIFDPKTYATTFRFYSEGGLTSRLVLGPFKRINVGLYLDSQHLIGGGEPRLIRPSVYFKLRVFDGTDILPGLALGYDNQGYLYQRPAKEFLHREKGLYLVGSHEFLLPNLELHAGVNVYDFDRGSLFGFVGSTFKIVNAFALLMEYDNIRDARENRFNVGGRFFVVPYFTIDVAARNIGRDSVRGAERIVRLQYVGNFPL